MVVLLPAQRSSSRPQRVTTVCVTLPMLPWQLPPLLRARPLQQWLLLPLPATARVQVTALALACLCPCCW
jgi:hypothetical protein